jgi:hypothetical protein
MKTIFVSPNPCLSACVNLRAYELGVSRVYVLSCIHLTRLWCGSTLDNACFRSAGGCMHTFEEHGWEWDTGIHYVGRIGKKDEVSRVLLDSVTDGCVEWEPLADSFDVVQVGDHRYRLASGRKRFLQALLDQFPNDHAAIHGYFEHMKRSKNSSGAVVFLPKIMDLLPAPIKMLINLKEAIAPFSREYCDKTALEVVQSLTDNKVHWYFFGRMCGTVCVCVCVCLCLSPLV